MKKSCIILIGLLLPSLVFGANTQVTIPNISGGEKASPASTDKMPLHDGTNTKWATIGNIVKSILPEPGAIGGTTPAAGTFTTLIATSISTSPSSTPRILLQDSDNAAGTATFDANSSGGTNDIILTLRVEDSGGENQGYVELDGVAEEVHLLKKTRVSDGGLIGLKEQFVAVFDGGGSEIADNKVVYINVPYDCTLTGWTLLGDVSGAIQLDVWKDTYANYPPTNSDSITNSHEPAIAANGIKNTDVDISDWTTVTCTAGDVIAVSVDSCTTITWANLMISATRR
jgi:hypothetical protein